MFCLYKIILLTDVDRLLITLCLSGLLSGWTITPCSCQQQGICKFIHKKGSRYFNYFVLICASFFAYCSNVSWNLERQLLWFLTSEPVYFPPHSTRNCWNYWLCILKEFSIFKCELHVYYSNFLLTANFPTFFCMTTAPDKQYHFAYCRVLTSLITLLSAAPGNLLRN